MLLCECLGMQSIIMLQLWECLIKTKGTSCSIPWSSLFLSKPSVRLLQILIYMFGCRRSLLSYRKKKIIVGDRRKQSNRSNFAPINEDSLQLYSKFSFVSVPTFPSFGRKRNELPCLLLHHSPYGWSCWRKEPWIIFSMCFLIL